MKRDSKPTSLGSLPELGHFSKILQGIPDESFFILKKTAKGGHYSLKDLISVKDPQANFQDQQLEEFYFCFADPSEYDSPSWIMRTYAAFLHLTW